MAAPDMWGRSFFLSVTKKGGTEIQLGSVVDPTSLEIGLGESGGESFVNAANGRSWMDTPEEDGEVTFTMKGNTSVDPTAAAGGLFQAFVGGTYDSSDTMNSDTGWAASDDRARDKFMVAVLQTDDAAALTAAGTTAASTASKRFYVKSARLTALKESWSDGTNGVEVTFKFPPFNKAGTAKTYQFQSSATNLTAVDYTSGDSL